MAEAQPGRNAAPTKVSSYRPELQGLRAVAIMMVVTYHIWFGRVSGGVDVFLLISAFLLTGSFLRKMERGQDLAVTRYWLHAFKRLVPPAALVIAATIVAARYLLPPERWRDVISEAFASITYTQNWLLASKSVDYYAADHSTASPLQHFWSLSIQGQVFLLWPLLFLVAALLVKRFGFAPRRVLWAIFGGITLVSFVWSVYLTAADQTYAYFDTFTRLWEFSLGSVLALLLPGLERRFGFRNPKLPQANGARLPRVALGWVGLILMLSCAWVLDVQGAFPGWVALWPLLAACLVIGVGPTRTPWAVDRLLSSKPLQWLGDISYSLYLVHWPLLIVALVQLETVRLSLLQGSALIAVSIVLAWAITRLVDSPIRYSAYLDARWWRSAIVIATGLSLVFGLGGWWQMRLDRQAERLASESVRNNPGARILLPGYDTPASAENPGAPEVSSAQAPTLPLLADIGNDWYGLKGNCKGRYAAPGKLDKNCRTAGKGQETLVVIGNSRIEQYAASLVPLARDKGWRVVTLFAPGCPYVPNSPLDYCAENNRLVQEYLADKNVAAVAMQYTEVFHGKPEQVLPGVEKLIQPLLDRGIDVIGIRDMPRLKKSPVECREESCAEDVSAQYLPELPTLPDLEKAPGSFYALDTNDLICPNYRCLGVIGNSFVWIDANHLTAYYAATMAPGVRQRLSEQGFEF
ncbi:acyltransferase family protein [Dermabacteraceae bacterium P7054]